MRTLTLKFCFIIATTVFLLTYTYNHCVILKDNPIRIGSNAMLNTPSTDLLEDGIVDNKISEYKQSKITYNTLMVD